MIEESLNHINASWIKYFDTCFFFFKKKFGFKFCGQKKLVLGDFYYYTELIRFELDQLEFSEFWDTGGPYPKEKKSFNHQRKQL